MEPKLCRVGSRRNKMSSGEGGKKVIERRLIGDVDGVELQAPFVSVAVEDIVMPYGHIKEMARCNPRWIVVVIFCARRGNRDPCGPQLRGCTACKRRPQRGKDVATEQTSLHLLISSEDGQINRG